MWKDFFYYSKAERYAIIVLLSLIGLNVTLYYSFSSSYEHSTSEKMLEVENRLFLDVDSIEHHRQKIVRHSHHPYASLPMSLSNFNPNTVDSLSLIRMGFPVRVVRNLLKYRRAGGTFRKVDDLAKIYGMSEEQFLASVPYLQLPSESHQEKITSSSDSVAVTKPRIPVFEHIEKFEDGMQVDLNTVDTSDLKRIPGIGSGIARQIVHYRQRLGGYHAIDQLKEIPYVTDEMLRWFRIGEVKLEKIDINKAGLEQLRNHPYMNFFKAKVILEHRRKRGKITSISQLSLYDEFSAEDLERLSPYFSFD